MVRGARSPSAFAGGLGVRQASASVPERADLGLQRLVSLRRALGRGAARRGARDEGARRDSPSAQVRSAVRLLYDGCVLVRPRRRLPDMAAAGLAGGSRPLDRGVQGRGHQAGPLVQYEHAHGHAARAAMAWLAQCERHGDGPLHRRFSRRLLRRARLLVRARHSHVQARLCRSERRHAQALHNALLAFRRNHADVVLVAFNGFVGDVDSAAAELNPFNTQWLETFDSLYAGDPRPSDLPQMDLWRAIDIYSDDMVRHFAQAGVPLERIDSTAFMLGNTATNYFRKTRAWRGSLLLMAARGGWINTVHGNLEFLDDEDARWFAKVQAIYAPLQSAGHTRWFGGNPGTPWSYGFGSEAKDGALYAVVNPSQGVRTLRLPRLSSAQEPNIDGRVLFHDDGFTPVLKGDTIRLGPGELALVGFGRYDGPENDLGTEADIRIPKTIELLPAHFRNIGSVSDQIAVETEIAAPSTGDLRNIMQQRDPDGSVVRATSHETMGKYFTIRASQNGAPLPVEIRYDRRIWSGLSWAVGEVRHDHIAPGKPIRIRLTSAESDPSVHLDARVYNVEY